MLQIRDLDPEALADEVQEALEASCRSDAHALGYELAPSNRPSEIRQTICEIARYARSGDVPEGLQLIVQRDVLGSSMDFLIETAPSFFPYYSSCEDLPDVIPKNATRTQHRVHQVMLAALAREALHLGRPVPSAYLAALASVTSAAVRGLLSKGKLRRWRAGVSSKDRRVWVHPDDARRWITERFARPLTRP